MSQCTSCISQVNLTDRWIYQVSNAGENPAVDERMVTNKLDEFKEEVVVSEFNVLLLILIHIPTRSDRHVLTISL